MIEGEEWLFVIAPFLIRPFLSLILSALQLTPIFALVIKTLLFKNKRFYSKRISGLIYSLNFRNISTEDSVGNFLPQLQFYRLRLII